MRTGLSRRFKRGGFRPAVFLVLAVLAFAPLLAAGGPCFAAVATAAPPSAAAPQKVDGPTISTLIRTTVIALHQANVTGNYTVLRDLGANELQVANTAADLAARFADFRQKHINLASTVLFDPILDRKPELGANGVLHLVGHFPTQPLEVVFDLTFQFEAAAWRIAQISVGTRIAPPSGPSGPDIPDKFTPTPRPRPAKP